MTLALLAIDTATEQCSVAVRTSSGVIERVVPTARGHADMILTLVAEVLRESALSLSQLNGLAFGRGPGSFTGVRIAVGVVQGLSLATGLPVAGISSLAAVAQRAALDHSLTVGSRLLVCMDARMKESYCARYRLGANGLVELIDDERVVSPDAIRDEPATIDFAAGTAWRAYPELRARYAGLSLDDTLLPRAREISLLAAHEFNIGRVVSARDVQPVYLRDQVAWPST
jgi:tRNA threonylcarbamoyladenosine biosynthesis protein TsaB